MTDQLWQLRRYVVKDGRLEDFLTAWRDGVRPLREEFGFKVTGAWIDEDGRRFVWLISHDSRESFERAERAYYQSEKRRRLPDPTEHLDQIETTYMSEVSSFEIRD